MHTKSPITLIKGLMIAACCLALSGCAAIGTAISHANLETQTLMSHSIFLTPVSDTKANATPGILLMITNTTDHPDFDIKTMMDEKLREKGYKLVNNPSQAQYILQINILQVGRSSETAAKEMMNNGYGGSLEGVAAGSAIAMATGGGLVVGGIAGGVADTVASNIVKDVTYSVISDVKLTQKLPAPKDGSAKQSVYKTRVLSTANQVNLKFATAMPKLEQGLADSLSGLFFERN